MPHKIRVSVIGEGEYLPRLIKAILEQNIIPQENLYLSEKSAGSKQAAEGTKAYFCTDDMNAVVKGEVVVICASMREFATVLSPVWQCMRGRILVGICPSEKLTLDYMAERVTGGIELVAATIAPEENSALKGKIHFSKNIRPFMKQPCIDLVDALCEQIIIEE